MEQEVLEITYTEEFKTDDKRINQNKKLKQVCNCVRSTDWVKLSPFYFYILVSANGWQFVVEAAKCTTRSACSNQLRPYFIKIPQNLHWIQCYTFVFYSSLSQMKNFFISQLSSFHWLRSLVLISTQFSIPSLLLGSVLYQFV